MGDGFAARPVGEAPLRQPGAHGRPCRDGGTGEGGGRDSGQGGTPRSFDEEGRSTERISPLMFFFFLTLSPEILFFLRDVKSGKPAFPFLVFPFLSLFTLSARFFAGTFPSSGRAGYLAELTNWSGGCVCFSALPCLRSRKSSLKPLERLLIDASSLPLDSLPAQEDLGWDWETRRHFRLQNTLF